MEKNLPGLYLVLHYSNAQFDCNPPQHSEVIQHIVSVALALALGVCRSFY